MMVLSQGRIGGFVMLVNTFLPVIVVVALMLMMESTVTRLTYQGCVAAGRLAMAFGDGAGQQAYLEAGDDAQRLAALEALKEAWARDSLAGESATPAPECLDKDLHLIVGHELLGRAVGGVEKQVQVVGSRVDGMKKHLSQRIPTAKAWKLDHVARSGIAKALAPGVNAAIDTINDLPVTMRTKLVSFGDKIADTVVWIFAPLAMVDYQRAAAGMLLAGFAADAAGLFTKFYWFFLALGVWLVVSYLFWVQRRLSAALALLRDRAAAV